MLISVIAFCSGVASRSSTIRSNAPSAPRTTRPSPAFFSVKVTVAKTAARRPLAILQATHDQDHRELARHVDLDSARKEALAGKKPEEKHPTMYTEHKYPNYRWGMAVDVDACIGCQACVVACHAENNVPIVGKAEAAYGRQVHWLRLERWADGDPGQPRQAQPERVDPRRLVGVDHRVRGLLRHATARIDVQPVPRGDQVSGHRLAHDAQPDEPDGTVSHAHHLPASRSSASDRAPGYRAPSAGAPRCL